MTYTQNGSTDGLTTGVTTVLPHAETPVVAAQPAGQALPASASLDAARRIDWRFLLASPDLGRVLYVGEDDTLSAALNLMCPIVEVAGAALLATGAGKPYDTVAARMPAVSLLPQLARMVGPGGSLYLEGGASRVRPLWTMGAALGAVVRRTHRCTPDDYRRTLHELGFGRVDAYWMWPDFDHCTRILAMDREKLAHQLCMQWRGRRQLQSVIGSRTAALMFRSGLVDCFVPAFCIVAEWSPKPATGILQ